MTTKLPSHKLAQHSPWYQLAQTTYPTLQNYTIPQSHKEISHSQCHLKTTNHTHSWETYAKPSKNKGTGINTDSIELFITLVVKCSIPSVKQDLRFIFNVICENNLPQPIKGYFTDEYLFCIYKDANDKMNLHLLGAIRYIIPHTSFPDISSLSIMQLALVMGHHS